MSTYKIVATTVFKSSLQRFRYFLENKYSKKLATDTIKRIKKRIHQNLSKNPEIAPISQRLVEMGITQYRQYTIDEHNLVFYRVDEGNKTVVLLAVMDSRQSVPKMLYEVVVLM